MNEQGALKLGFDVDDTLIDLRRHAFGIYNRKLGKAVTEEMFDELKRVEIHEPFGLTDAEGKKMWTESLEEIYFTDCPLYADAAEVLQELDREGHEIYYITARPDTYCQRTKEWLILQGFPLQNDRFYCGMGDLEKAAIIRRLGLDIYVDDKPEIAESLKEESVRTMIRDQSYNRHVNLPRIKDWSAFRTLMQKQ